MGTGTSSSQALTATSATPTSCSPLAERLSLASSTDGSPAGPPLNGTYTGGKLHFTTVPPPAVAGSPISQGSTAASTTYDGTVADGKLNLEWHRYEGQLIKGMAIRSTEAEAAPPKPIPLPPLHDIADNGLVRTPPMGWNSWNKFAGRITADDVRTMADAMISSGMSKVGYNYINIDDTWEAGRDAQGNILTNKKFPDMKALADYVHSKGFKIGIYSSPGPLTCAGYTASFGHEVQDAKQYAAWGIDYLKYDLCSDRAIYDITQPNQQGIYQMMGDALAHAGRPIVYSLCQYGLTDVWTWGIEGRRQPLAHHGRHQRHLGLHGQDRLHPDRHLQIHPPRPLERPRHA